MAGSRNLHGETKKHRYTNAWLPFESINFLSVHRLIPLFIENSWKEIDNSLGTEGGITLCYDYLNFYFMIMITYITDIISVPKIYIWLILLKQQIIIYICQ